MITLFGIDIGTLFFFVFSFLVGVVLVIRAVFFSQAETHTHRIVQGIIGVAYTALTIAAFMQLKAFESAADKVLL